MSGQDPDPLAGEIAAIAGQLSPEHLRAWVDVLRQVPEPVPAVVERLAEARPGYALAGLARRLFTAWNRAAPPQSGAAMALALETAGQLHRRLRAQAAEIVVSGPDTAAVPVRMTSSMVVEAIRAATDSLLIVSFVAHGVAPVIEALVAATDRGVHVDLVMESSVAAGGTLKGAGADAAFGELVGRATFWEWPAKHRTLPGSTTRAALHAKVITVDHRMAVVGSANLTDRALAHNIEMGVVLRDPRLVRRIVTHFRSLMDPGQGPLVARSR